MAPLKPPDGWNPHSEPLEVNFPFLYEATVEDVSDPQNLGRIKARVHGVYDSDVRKSPASSLPWCYPCFAPGTFIVPDWGEHVWVMFRHGDVDYPVYMGVFHGNLPAGQVRGRLPSSPKPPLRASTNDIAPIKVQGTGAENDFLFEVVFQIIVRLLFFLSSLR